jgi:phosphoglycolate phosphatase
MGRKIVFFDFDGVLADSFGAAFTVNKMIHPLITEDIYRKRFEGNINENLKEEEVKKVHRDNVDFFAEYEPRLLACDVFPGMKEVIEAWAKDRTLIIVSSTNTDLIKKFLSLNHLDHYFTEIMGNDVHKSKITKIEMTFDKYGIGAEDCLFITDTLGDIKEAHHMKVPTVAVTWGYQSIETLKKGAPPRIVNTPQELLSVFDK